MDNVLSVADSYRENSVEFHHSLFAVLQWHQQRQQLVLDQKSLTESHKKLTAAN